MSALHRGVIDLKLEKNGFRDGMIFPETKPRDHSLTKLTKFCPSLTTYLPLVDTGEGIPLGYKDRKKLNTGSLMANCIFEID